MVSVADGGKTEQTVANPGSPLISVYSKIIIRMDEYGCRSDSNFNDCIENSSVGSGDVEPEADVYTDLEPDTKFVVTSHLASLFRYFSFFVSLDLLFVAH